MVLYSYVLSSYLHGNFNSLSLYWVVWSIIDYLWRWVNSQYSKYDAEFLRLLAALILIIISSGLTIFSVVFRIHVVFIATCSFITYIAAFSSCSTAPSFGTCSDLPINILFRFLISNFIVLIDGYSMLAGLFYLSFLPSVLVVMHFIYSLSKGYATISYFIFSVTSWYLHWC